MDDAELISILVDTDAGLAPMDGYGPTVDYVRALIAERDRFRRLFLAANQDRRFAWGELRRENELHVEFKTERNRLREIIDNTMAAVGDDAPAKPEFLPDYIGALLGEHVQSMAALDSAVAAVGWLTAERDRLRSVSDRSREQLQAEVLAHTEAAGERDQLRAVVRRAQEAWVAHTADIEGSGLDEWMAAWDALRVFGVSGESTDG